MNKRITIDHCILIELPNFNATKGNITSLNNGIDSPFEVNRVFYIYDIPSGEDRGAHAHKLCHQLLVAVTGSFEVEIFDGNERNRFLLNQPNKGLHVPPGIWASEFNFSGGGVCLVLASHEYDENDYVRDISSFISMK